ncbi:MAG: PKD domain-containing protein [bacterium]
MIRRFSIQLSIAILIVCTLGCSGSSPIEPDNQKPQTATIAGGENSPGTNLWGIYEISIDTENQVAEAVPFRHALFAANVVKFVNAKPAYLGFDIKNIIVGADFTDVDIDVSITHPFPGLHMYDGYDVRGVFMGDGSGSLQTNGSLVYPVLGTDQIMLDDPNGTSGNNGGPDGYTRWFNATEFANPSMPLFGYTPGKFATPGFTGTATVCPCKYFADELGADDDLFTWINANPETFGVFSAGSINTRNYYIRFPNSTGVKFAYAILANWESPDIHPSNAPEPIVCKVLDNSSLYYVDPDVNGGMIDLDISLWDWLAQISAGVMEDYSIIIESEALEFPYVAEVSDMTPVSGDEFYSTYQIEIAPDIIPPKMSCDTWVLVEVNGYDYSNPYGVTNLAWDDPLTAFFRFDIPIDDSAPSGDPVCDVVIDDSSPEMPYSGPPTEFTFDASGSYDPDGGPLSYEWDFDDDGIFGDSFGSGTDSKPVKLFTESNTNEVCVRITDDESDFAVCCVQVDIAIVVGNLKNIPLRTGVAANDLGTIAGTGDLLILYSDYEVWKYLLSESWQTGHYQYTVTSTPYTFQPTMMDANSLGCAVFGYSTPTVIWGWNVDPDGNNFMHGGFGAITEKKMPDVCAFGTSGTFADNLLWYTGGFWSGASYRNWWYNYGPPVYNDSTRIWGSSYIGYGYSGVHHQYVISVEGDKNGDNLWVMEGEPENHCSRWKLVPPYGWPNLVYADQYFPTPSDSTHWHAPIDISRDQDNRLCILDDESGQGIITFWTGSSAGGSYIGQIGNSSTISEQPRRIDGSDHDGNVFVIHGDSYSPSTGYYLSIFTPSELP